MSSDEYWIGHRIEAGYGKLNVSIEELGSVPIEGVMENDVPTWVEIEALPTVPEQMALMNKVNKI